MHIEVETTYKVKISSKFFDLNIDEMRVLHKEVSEALGYNNGLYSPPSLGSGPFFYPSIVSCESNEEG